MSMVKSGFAFHVHHNQLWEFCTDYDDRVDIIKKNKPENERELRLRLFKLIPGDRLPKLLIEARRAFNEARRAYNEARQVCSADIIKLHDELCPNCPFDGDTIFSDKLRG